MNNRISCNNIQKEHVIKQKNSSKEFYELRALTGAGIIYEDVDRNDRRRKLIYLTYEEDDQKINTPALGGKPLDNEEYLPLQVDKEGVGLPHPFAVFISTDSKTLAEDSLKKVREFTQGKKES